MRLHSNNFLISASNNQVWRQSVYLLLSGLQNDADNYKTPSIMTRKLWVIYAKSGWPIWVGHHLQNNMIKAAAAGFASWKTISECRKSCVIIQGKRSHSIDQVTCSDRKQIQTQGREKWFQNMWENSIRSESVVLNLKPEDLKQRYSTLAYFYTQHPLTETNPASLLQPGMSWLLHLY